MIRGATRCARKSLDNRSSRTELNPATTIDEVIAQLEQIVADGKTNNDPLGYFAALYLQVTIKVKEGIANDFFENGPRMESLDVIFAKRYLQAYNDHKAGGAVTQSWIKSFNLGGQYWPIVLQHLLIGMNAHINLDLGIAAAEVSRNKNIDDLETDFNKINEILSSLVGEVERDLASIWPFLKILLKLAGRVDNFLVDFSMKLARNGAWKFANSLVGLNDEEYQQALADRDVRVGNKARIITNPGIIIRAVFAIVRLGERSSVAGRIQRLAQVNVN